jgi:mannosyltransferase OCH1-like enzyme
MIPKIIHQLWIGDIQPPLKIMNTWQEQHPEFIYIFWQEDNLKDLRIPKKYQQKIDNMEEINGKADMYRWIILRDYGGIFVDADMLCIHPFSDKHTLNSWFCFENEIARQGLCATTIMAFDKDHLIPNKCIEHILKNHINSPAWMSVGPKLLSDIFFENQKECEDVDILPSYTFLPEHHTGSVYNGHGKVYATHLWGSTKKQNNKLNNEVIPDYMQPPSKKNFITIDITNLKEDQIKYFNKSLPFLQGRYNVIVKCKDQHTRPQSGPVRRPLADWILTEDLRWTTIDEDFEVVS